MRFSCDNFACAKPADALTDDDDDGDENDYDHKKNYYFFYNSIVQFRL